MPCNITEKLEEGRVFFEVYPPPGRGDVAEPYTVDQERAQAWLEKARWEKAHPSSVLVQFHKDPFAGGVRTERTPNTGSEDNPEGNTNMVAYPLWVGEVIVRNFKDKDEEDAWRARNK